MRKVTTTNKINDAITNNLLIITKAETYNKTSRKTDVIDVNTFKENLDFLAESGIFADCIGWYYEDNCDSDSDYIAECSRMDRRINVIVTVYLKVCDRASNETVEKELLFLED